jgi:hypothetical protein
METGIVMLEEMSISNMAELYNKLAVDLGRSKIKKFENRQSATARLSEIMALHIVWKEEKRVMENKVKDPNARRGRLSGFAGKKIKCLVSENPRVAGSCGWHSMKVILENPEISYEEFVEKGGRRVDLAWDLKLGRLELV